MKIFPLQKTLLRKWKGKPQTGKNIYKSYIVWRTYVQNTKRTHNSIIKGQTAQLKNGHFFLKIFIYFWLCWVFVSVQGPPPAVASGGHSSSRCAGLSLSRPLLLRSTGSRCAGSVVVAHGSSCSAACGILPDQGSNPCPLHWQADSQPLCHQGSPKMDIFEWIFHQKKKKDIPKANKHIF